jgi:predicted amino acid dehydrogenase
MKNILVHHFPQVGDDLVLFLCRDEVRRYLRVSSDYKYLHDYDIVMTGTNSLKSFIDSEHLKEDALVIDIGVPRNVNPQIQENRKDVQLLLGGLVALPSLEQQKGIDSSFFPLEKNEIFACMAETLLLTFMCHYLPQHKFTNGPILHIGSVKKEKVLELMSYAEYFGLSLGRFKQDPSY